jgi:hypothetical protein
MQLSEFPRVRYTMMEYHLFNMIPKSGKTITSTEIANARDKLGKWDVKHPLQIITTMMDRLAGKVQDNREAFRIRKDGKYPGHPTVEYWIEPMAKKKVNGK